MFNFQYVLSTDSNCIVVPVYENKIFLNLPLPLIDDDVVDSESEICFC